MKRLIDSIRSKRAQGPTAVIPFLVAGDPDLETTYRLLRVLAEEGAAAIEVGVPFSDPVADGPTIQQASQRALARGTQLTDVLEMTREYARHCESPLVLFSYLNPLLRYGTGRLIRELPGCGIGGVLVTDLPHEESAEFRGGLARAGIDLISLVAPTTSDERLRAICNDATGFVYAISRSGVTGAERSPESPRALVERVRRNTDVPIAVGFGISRGAQVAEVCSYADAAVVGSALVEIIANATSTALEHEVRNFISSLQESEAQHVSRNA